MAVPRRAVLVVEDEFLVALSTIEALESIACDVVGPAADVAAGLHLARTRSLDAAVLDIDLSGEMVWPLAEHLQRRGVPFVFLSAFVSVDVIPAIFAAVPYLEKPLEKTSLLRHLAAMWKDGELAQP